MDLLPQDIRHKVFSKKTIGGVSHEEVSSFLSELSNEFEQMKHKNRSLNNQVVQLNNELSRYKDIENKLFQALENGEKLNEKIKLNAEEEAKLIINKSKFQANKMLKEARNRAQKILEKTEKYCKDRIAATDQKVQVKKEEIERLEYGRKRVIAELNHFMNKTLGKIQQLADKSSFRFSSFQDTVPADIDWDFDNHFDKIVKKKKTEPTQDMPRKTTGIHQDLQKKTQMQQTSFGTSINDRFQKPQSIHERYQKRKGLTD